MAKKIITNLHELVSDASSAYIYANKEEFKSTVPGPQGLRGLKGEDGVDGTSVTVTSIQNNIDKSITIVFSDGTVHTTDPLKGKDGTSITVTNVTSNSNGTLTIDFSDGTSYTTKDLTGPRGFKGDTGDHVHHISYQRSKDSLGNDIGPTTPSRRGYTDIYSMWASQEEFPEMFIGNFSVYNGLDTLSAEDTFKIDSIEIGATADQEAFEVPYDNSISDLLSEDVQNSIDELSATKLNILEKGQPNGVASLDSSGLVPSAHLPSYVDDVLEVDTKADLPTIGEKDKIYIVVNDESSNGDTSTYRWTGTVYAEVSNTLNVSDVKALYEANPDTNAYTDAEKSRVDISTSLATTAQTLSTAVNELDNRVAAIEDNTTLAEYGITDTYTKTEVQTILPKVGLDLTNVVAPSAGQLAWNIEEQTIDVGLNGATLQMGQELLIRVRNNSGSIISNGTAVMAAGTIGNSGRIVVDRANLTNSNAKRILGIVTESIFDGAEGFCTTFGKVRGIDTRGTAFGETWSDGDILYVKDSGNGALTNIEPLKTEVKLPIAIVIKAHSNGTMFVRVNSIDENATLAEINKIEEW